MQDRYNMIVRIAINNLAENLVHVYLEYHNQKNVHCTQLHRAQQHQEPYMY